MQCDFIYVTSRLDQWGKVNIVTVFVVVAVVIMKVNKQSPTGIDKNLRC